MKLSFKDLKFILEALEHLLSRYDTRLKEIEDLEEYDDEASDLGNDYLFVESLKLEIEKNINNNESSNHDALYQLLAARNCSVDINPTEQPSIIITNEQLSSINNNNESINHDFMFLMPQAEDSPNLESIIQSTSSLSINERLLLVEAITKSIRKEPNLTTGLNLI